MIKNHVISFRCFDCWIQLALHPLSLSCVLCCYSIKWLAVAFVFNLLYILTIILLSKNQKYFISEGEIFRLWNTSLIVCVDSFNSVYTVISLGLCYHSQANIFSKHLIFSRYFWLRFWVVLNWIPILVQATRKCLLIPIDLNLDVP